MKLSSLQKFILKQTWEQNKYKISRDIFYNYYKKEKKKAPSDKMQSNTIARSIDRLINKGLAIGYGEKTKHRLYIYQIRLTALGKKTAKSLFGEQTKLPFKKTL